MDYSQEVYEAVRSKIHNADIGAAVENVMRECNFSFYGETIRNCMTEDSAFVRDETTKPSILLRPKLYPDGNQWCALYGDNLQEGLAGFGETPALAMADFDKNYSQQKLMVKP